MTGYDYRLHLRASIFENKHKAPMRSYHNVVTIIFTFSIILSLFSYIFITQSYWTTGKALFHHTVNVSLISFKNFFINAIRKISNFIHHINRPNRLFLSKDTRVIPEASIRLFCLTGLKRTVKFLLNEFRNSSANTETIKPKTAFDWIDWKGFFRRKIKLLYLRHSSL